MLGNTIYVAFLGTGIQATMDLTPYLYPEIKLFTAKALKQIQYNVREYYHITILAKRLRFTVFMDISDVVKLLYLTSMLNSLNYYFVQ
jgi:hypothetical protein